MVPPEEEERDSVVIDRRLHERFAVSVEMTLTCEHQLFTALSGDISRGGVFVATYKDVPLGTPVTVRMTLPGGATDLHGVVRWTRPPAPDGHGRPGIGIAFENVSEESRALLDAFCREREPLLME